MWSPFADDSVSVAVSCAGHHRLREASAAAFAALHSGFPRLVTLGWSNERIGDEMGVTLNTVRTHLANLRGKLDAETRLEAVMAAVRLGILELR